MKSIEEALKEFEKFESPDEVADFFRAKGLKEDRSVMVCVGCPTAQYISQTCGVRAMVGMDFVLDRDSQGSYLMPEVLQEFVRIYTGYTGYLDLRGVDK